MFCPECKAEYRPGFTRCNDCQVELVEVLEESHRVKSGEVPDAEDSDYVVIATARGPLEDSQICSFLEANGIPAQVRTDSLRKTHSIGIWATQILVPRAFAFAARALLAKADHGSLEIEET